MSTLSDYRDREHWSYSSLNQLLNICGLQWAFQRLYGLIPEFRPVSMSFGSAFHRVLEWVAHTRKDGQRPKDSDAQELFTDLWRRQLDEDGEVKFDEDENAETCAAQGRDMVACYTRAIDEDEQVLHVNKAFCTPLVDANGNTLPKPLIGEIDCVVEKIGGIILTDWKTSGRRWPKDKAEKDLQPTAYLYAASVDEQFGKCPIFRFDVIVKNKTPVFEQHATFRVKDQFDRLAELVKLADRMVEHEVFVPNESGFYCSGCGFQGACKAWHRQQAKVISVAA